MLKFSVHPVASDAADCGLITPHQIVEKIKDFQQAQAVCWLHYALRFCIVENGVLHIGPGDLQGFDKHLVRLRVFDKEKELHVWCSHQQLHYRLRKDIEGEGAHFTESELVLWGTSDKWAPDRKILTVTEERGTAFELPFFDQQQNLSEKDRLVLVTRNYIDYNDIGQAGYVDCRFVAIKKQK